MRKWEEYNDTLVFLEKNFEAFPAIEPIFQHFQAQIICFVEPFSPLSSSVTPGSNESVAASGAQINLVAEQSLMSIPEMEEFFDSNPLGFIDDPFSKQSFSSHNSTTSVFEFNQFDGV